MLGLPLFGLTPAGYAWVAFRFFTGCVFSVLLMLRLLAVPMLAISLVSFAILYPLNKIRGRDCTKHIDKVITGSVSRHWGDGLYVLLLSITVCFAGHILSSAHSPFATSANSDDAYCQEMLTQKLEGFSGISDDDAPKATLLARVRGMTKSEVVWCMTHRDALLPGKANLLADDAHAETGEDRLNLRFGKLVLLNVALIVALMGIRRFRIEVPELAPTVSLLGNFLTIALVVMIIVNLTLLPQNFGALIMRPDFEVVDLPLRQEVPAGMRGDPFCTAYLMTLAPETSKEIVLLRFPIDTTGSLNWEMRTFSRDQAPVVRVSGKVDVLSCDLPALALVNRLDAARLLTSAVSGKEGLPLDDCLQLLQRAKVWTRKEALDASREPDSGGLAARSVAKWIIMSQCPPKQRNELLATFARVGEKRACAVAVDLAEHFQLFVDYTGSNMDARQPITRQDGYLMLQRASIVPKPDLLSALRQHGILPERHERGLSEPAVDTRAAKVIITY